MARTDFLKFLQKEGAEFVELCAGRVKDGREFYAFLQMDIESRQRYQAALSQKTSIDLSAYGKILHTGWGTAPDAATCAWITKTYTDNLKILQAIGQDALAVAGILKKNSKEGNAYDG